MLTAHPSSSCDHVITSSSLSESKDALSDSRSVESSMSLVNPVVWRLVMFLSNKIIVHEYDTSKKIERTLPHRFPGNGKRFGPPSSVYVVIQVKQMPHMFAPHLESGQWCASDWTPLASWLLKSPREGKEIVW